MSVARNPEETKTYCDVLIQGAGIGGLTLAIALQQHGYRVKLVEQATELAEIGAGIWMAANPMQVFARLGFAGRVDHRVVEVSLVVGDDKRLVFCVEEDIHAHVGNEAVARDQNLAGRRTEFLRESNGRPGHGHTAEQQRRD